MSSEKGTEGGVDLGEVGGGSPAGGSSSDNGANALDQIIPRNLRKSMLPFINGKHKDDIAFFSFRTKDLGDTSKERAWYQVINIIPDDCSEFDKDVGLKLMLCNDEQNPSIKTILNNIPAIQIREYVQDTRLQLLTGLFNNLIKGGKAGFSAEENEESIKEFLAIGTAIGKGIKRISFWKELVGSIQQVLSQGLTDVYDDEDTNTKLVLHLIHGLYYRMLGSTTTGIYILPCVLESYLNSDGSNGWDGVGGITDSSTAGNTVLGKLINFAISHNIKIITEPIWNGGNNNDGETISLTVNLFNDTKTSAMTNFLFVNTIIPQNMWTQYAIFQLPPSVYDIKVEGGQRLFMCSGKFECKNKGVLRNPGKEFIRDVLYWFSNTCIEKKKSDVDYFIKNGLIKIPDVYELNMTFKSLLPNNFNQYLFRFAANNNVIDHQKRQEAFYMDKDFVNYVNDTIEAIKSDASDAAQAENQEEVIKKLDASMQAAQQANKA